MSMARQIAAEGLGTALLLAVVVVVGSGIMGQRMAGGNDGIALLGNTLSTGAGLVVLIHMFGPISGAHFNPAVALVMLLRREMTAGRTLAHITAQGVGAVFGVWLTHVMFAEPVLQLSAHVRAGWPQGLAELVATFGLIGAVPCVRRSRP